MTSLKKREENKRIRLKYFQERLERKRRRMVFRDRVYCLMLFLGAVTLILLI